MKCFWNGFEKQASKFGVLREGVRKAIKNPENVLDYKKMSKPKPKSSGVTLDYSKMGKEVSDQDMPIWKKKLEAKRHETVSKNKGVFHTMPRAALPVT